MYEYVGRYAGSLDGVWVRYWSINPRPNAHGYQVSIIDKFPSDWKSCAFVTVWPNGQILPHDASTEKFVAGTSRYHLVMSTNPRAWSMHDNQWQRLRQGCIYRVDPRIVHAAVNWGKELRVHLVIDDVDYGR